MLTFPKIILILAASLAVRPLLAEMRPGNDPMSAPSTQSETQSRDNSVRFAQAVKLMQEGESLLKQSAILPTNHPFEAGYRRALSIAERQAKDTRDTSMLDALTRLQVTTARQEEARANEARFRARDRYTAALAILEPLVHADPGNDAFQYPLSQTYSALASISGSYKDRMARYDKALAIVQKLAVENPGDRQWQHARAELQQRIGTLQFSNGGELPARSAKMAELDLREKLVEADPSNGTWQHDLALNYDRLGEMFHTIGNRSQAHDAFKAGFEVHQLLEKMDPNNAQWQRDLAANRLGAGNFEAHNGKPGVGDAMLAEVLRLHQVAIEKRPSDLVDQLALRDSYLRTADELTDANQREEAIVVYETAIAHLKRLAARDATNSAWLYYQLEFYFLIGFEHERLLGNALGGPRLGSGPEDQKRRVRAQQATQATVTTMRALIGDLLALYNKAGPRAPGEPKPSPI